MRRGVFFLANDFVLDQAIAFLNSFRRYNPAIPLCHIPYDDDADGISALARTYRFTTFTDRALLGRCDDFSRAFHPRPVGQYRKLVAWHGEFDEFVYIDCDTVVLHEIEFVFELLAEYAFVTSHSDLPGMRRWVWRPSIFRTDKLDRRQIGFAASTGFLASRRGVLSLDGVAAALPDAVELAPHMVLECCEQPLLNYLIVTSGQPYTSLTTIARESDPTVPLERWAGHTIGSYRDGQLATSDGSTVMLVHWAGEFQKARWEGRQIPHHELWQYYRTLTTA